jgi:hypothetical protein
MSKPEVLRIRIPEGLLIPKLYLYSFLNLVEASRYEVGQYIELKSKDTLEAIIDGIKTVKEILEKRRREKPLQRLSELPMSGNDKKIFTKLCLELKCDLDSIEIFGAYVDVLKSPKVGGLERLRRGLENFNMGSGGYALPSIFKLELYALTRGTFFKDGFSIDQKVSSDFLVLMLAGYLVSRIGRTRLDEKSWVSVHILPLELAWSKNWWLILQQRLSGLWYGIRPVDALVLYLLINLWDLLKSEPHNLLILGVTDPMGSIPAAASVSVNAPLREVYVRTERLLEHILKEEWSKNSLMQLVRRSLSIGQPGREIAEKFVKLIFLSIQDDAKALEELSLMSSRLETRILAIKQPKDTERELLVIAKDARRIAERILEHRFRLL